MKNLLFATLLLSVSSCTGPAVQESTSSGAETAADSGGIIRHEGEVPRDTLYEDRTDLPVEPAPPDYDTTQWTDIADLEPEILIDMRYATDSNFVGEKMYECGRCFLRPEVAEAVVAAHRELTGRGLGLKMLDCYRPQSIQWKLWEKVPDPRYVTDPRKGSMHNRGAAVDLTLVDRQGRELTMGTPYDFFGQEAYHTYTALPDSVLANRQLLKELMEGHQFRAIRTEWWHYSFTGRFYELSDMRWNCPEE